MIEFLGPEPEDMRPVQTRWSSLMEALTNTGIGYVIAWVASIGFFRVMNIPMTLHDLFWYTWFMTIISVIRGYGVRRMYETRWWRRLFHKS